jgi:hypothetical protein
MTNFFSRLGAMVLLVALAEFALSPPAAAESKTLRFHFFISSGMALNSPRNPPSEPEARTVLKSAAVRRSG